MRGTRCLAAALTLVASWVLASAAAARAFTLQVTGPAGGQSLL